ncbi:MAG: DUF1365 domain-containing protein [Phycisphaeraceae bacterium]|nr:MAG: DUF1365 domain-containing protein [Phycisphaeraceae bacterium]
MTLASCIYDGWVRHRRYAPKSHAFTMPLFMLYIDLAELPELFRGSPLWSTRRFAPAWLRRADYLGGRETPARSIDECVRTIVAERTGRRPTGPVRMLTHARQWGYCFNPVTFYYCFDEAGERVEAVAAEITNTPWKERHTYVLSRSAAGEGALRRRFEKEFHISPFMPMDMKYDWTLPDPRDRLFVHMNNRREGRREFDATLVMRRREASGAMLARMLVKHPAMTLGVAGRIHLEALRLWLKRVPVHSHPDKRLRRAEGRA